MTSQLPADPTESSDVCVHCEESLADMLLGCGHRVLCNECLDKRKFRAERAGRLPMCPVCREPVNELTVQPARDLQVCKTLVRDADTYGALLDFSPDGSGAGSGEFADTQTMGQVTEAVRACARGEVPIHALRKALDAQLTPSQREVAFLMLNKHVDLHQTLLNLDDALVRRESVWKEVAQHMIRRTMEGKDTPAMAGRATIAAVGDVIAISSFGVRQAANINRVDLVTNLGVLLILGGVDLYRWSKDELTDKQLVCNIGEHVSGCGAGVLGSVGGAAAAGALAHTTGAAALATTAGAALANTSGGAAIGAAIGVAGGPVTVATVLGALLGGFLADLIARKVYQAGVDKYCAEETEAQAKQRAVNDAAATLGIDLKRHGFALAKNKFRRRILDNHPDKARANGNAEDNVGAARIIAAWQIIRGHYEKRGELDNGNGLKEPESFIVVWVMKTRETIDSAWRVTRTWFGDMENSPVHQAELERVDEMIVYM